MKFSEQTLLAYVDGRLDEKESAEVREAMAQDAEVKQMVERLGAVSPATIKAAFDVMLERPAPAMREDRDGGRQPSLQDRRAGFTVPLALAASVLVMIAGVAGGYALRGVLEHDGPMADSWVVPVAQYQVLYGRETLAAPSPSASAVRASALELGSRLGLELHIPDFSAHGVIFKRAQELSLDGAPLVQLAYLPVAGKPIAYCITATDGPDIEPTPAKAEGLDLYHWRRDGFAHVIIGETDRRLLRELAMTAFDPPGPRT